MISRLLSETFLRAPDDGGAGGASNTPAAPPEGAPAGGNGAPPASSPAPGDANAAPPPAAAPAPGSAYRPEGLPDHLLGQSDHETIDHLAKALKGYRDRDAQAGGVPDDPKGYLADVTEIPDAAKGYFEALSADPVFDRIAGIAKAEGVPTGTFAKLMGAFLEGNAEAGMFEPLIDKEAERAALVPDAAKSLPKGEQDAAIDRRMNDNIAWLAQMQARGMPKEAADYAQMMLFDTARGHQFVEFFRSQIEGGSRPLGGGGAGSASTIETMKAEMVTNPKYNPRRAEYDAAATRDLQARILAAAST